MKKIFTLLIGIVFAITVLNAQDAPPQAFSFKATIQGANGQTVVNKTIRLRISILQDDINGFVTYSEYFTPTTNHYSQVDVEIGRGNVLSGIFSSIDWSAHTYFLKVEVDAKGGTNYQLLSVTQLLSVPYALYAGAAGNAFSGNYSDLIGAPILANVATTGNYNDLINQPTLFSGDYNDLINLPPLFSGNYNDLSNKPTLFDGTWSSLTGKPSFSTVAISGSWNDLINKPTTLAGYGITDALSNSHPTSVITAIDITNWNTAFNWGNHSGLYRPVSYVPAWSEIIGKPTFATVATSGSYNDLNNKPTIDGSETKVMAGTNVTITGVGTAASPYVINSTGGGGSSHYIGESYGGGIVFWVDESGQHGKVCAKSDQSGGIRWYAGTYGITNAKSRGAGKVNTAIIIAAQVAIGDDGFNYAARICNELYIIEGEIDYYDWYLPSEMDLRLMYENKAIINATAIAKGGSAFADDFYWSSTEGDANYAGSKDFYINRWGNYDKSSTRCVRAVRAF